MGLDIFAYTQLKLIPKTHDRREWFRRLQVDQHHVCFSKEEIEMTERDFPGHAADLAPGIYAWKTGHSFKAGSYGGYNDWRSDLAEFAGTSFEQVRAGDHSESAPFVELINFYDNQGLIGPTLAGKLAADFVNNAKSYKRWAKGNEDGLQAYKDWLRAFTLAADSGAVHFA